MKKILIISSIIVPIVTIYFCLQSDYNRKITFLQDGEIEGYWTFETVVTNHYVNTGQFPVAVKQSEYMCPWDSTMTLSDTAYCNILIDNFSRDRSEILIYHPIYNRNNGKRESFILLSAGIDGKINNVISDTLYMDSWWEQINIYNLKEIITATFYKQALNTLYVKTKKRAGFINYSDKQPSLKSIGPRFSFINYFWGKKDYVVRYGLPYYINYPIIDSYKEIDELKIIWNLKPEIVMN